MIDDETLNAHGLPPVSTAVELQSKIADKEWDCTLKFEYYCDKAIYNSVDSSMCAQPDRRTSESKPLTLQSLSRANNLFNCNIEEANALGRKLKKKKFWSNEELKSNYDFHMGRTNICFFSNESCELSKTLSEIFQSLNFPPSSEREKNRSFQIMRPALKSGTSFYFLAQSPPEMVKNLIMEFLMKVMPNSPHPEIMAYLESITHVLRLNYELTMSSDVG